MSRCSPVSKRFKCQDNDDRDLISKLPQSVICHILSRLPSKDVARTSILSKDWVYKWTSIYNIDIDDEGVFQNKKKKNTDFVNFVDKILRPSNDLKSFRFVCHYKHSSTRLTAWISTALGRNTESFEIQFPHGLDLPRSFINNTSLRNLKLMPSPPSRYSKLEPSCTFKVPNDTCFPNLTCLYLKLVEILNEFRRDSDCLVLNLPVLQTLELLSCKFSNANLVEIHSPALKTFMCDTDPDTAVNVFSIKIFEARLVKFESRGDFPDSIILVDSVVLNATLENKGKSDIEVGLQVRKLLKGFSGITKLQLSAQMSKAIAQSQHKLPLPRYNQLRRLVMSVGDAKELFELLHSAPSLTSLEIDMDNTFVELDCDEVDPLPYCIISSLEEVRIKCNSWTHKKPVHLAKLLLKHGVKLKKLYLFSRQIGYSSNIKVIEQLLAFHRASACIGIAVC